MKQGRTLTELAVELERQHTSKRDFIADTRELELVPRLILQENNQPVQLPESLRLSNKVGDTLDFTLALLHESTRRFSCASLACRI